MRQFSFVQYCDLKIGIQVVEDILKLFSASFIKKVDKSGKEHFSLTIDAHPKKEDMLRNGWNFFDSLEELNIAVDIDNQPLSVRELVFREVSTIYEIEE